MPPSLILHHWKTFSRQLQFNLTGVAADEKVLFVSVTAVDKGGQTATVASNGIFVDTTAPEVGAFEIGTPAEASSAWWRDLTRLPVTWTLFYDLESDLATIEVAVGSSPGLTDLSDGWITIAREGTGMCNTEQDGIGGGHCYVDGLQLVHGAPFYPMLRAVNRGGLASQPVTPGRKLWAWNEPPTLQGMEPPQVVPPQSLEAEESQRLLRRLSETFGDNPSSHAVPRHLQEAAGVAFEQDYTVRGAWSVFEEVNGPPVKTVDVTVCALLTSSTTTSCEDMLVGMENVTAEVVGHWLRGSVNNTSLEIRIPREEVVDGIEYALLVRIRAANGMEAVQQSPSWIVDSSPPTSGSVVILSTAASSVLLDPVNALQLSPSYPFNFKSPALGLALRRALVR